MSAIIFMMKTREDYELKKSKKEKETAAQV